MPYAKALNILKTPSVIKTDANNVITSGAYNPLVSSFVNRVGLSTQEGLQVVGPDTVRTIDVIGVPTGLTPGGLCASPALQPGATVKRFLVPHAIAAGVLPLSLFEYDIVSRVETYVGRTQIAVPAGTSTARAIAHDDNNGAITGWKIFFETTNTTTPALGGLFMANNISRSQFVQTSFPTIALASPGDTELSNKNFHLIEAGGTNLLTTASGLSVFQDTKKIVAQHLTASQIFYVFDYSGAITTVNASGQTSDYFQFKTGVVPGFGTTFNLDTMRKAFPRSGPLAGERCVYISNATTGFFIKFSDLASGVVTFPNTAQWNKLGTGTDYITATWTQSVWSDGLDSEINYSTSGMFLLKKPIPNDPNVRVFGKNDLVNFEATASIPLSDFAALTVTGLFTSDGFLGVVSTAVGQRGLSFIDLSTDKIFALTHTGITPPASVISPVLKVKAAKSLALAFVNALNMRGVGITVQYRKTFAWADAWITLPDVLNLKDIAALMNIEEVQFKFLFNTLAYNGGNSQQIHEAYLAYDGLFEVSDKWLGWPNEITADDVSPAYSAFLQYEAYTAPVALRFQAIDLVTKVVVAQADTDTDFASFDKTSNSGVSWSAMTGANDYPNVALTSGVRFKWGGAVPSNVAIKWMEK